MEKFANKKEKQFYIAGFRFIYEKFTMFPFQRISIFRHQNIPSSYLSYFNPIPEIRCCVNKKSQISKMYFRS